MTHVVNTNQLLAEAILSPAQATIIAARSRETMVALAVNAILCVGILAATFGLIFWLADAMSVAVLGAIFVIAGGSVLNRGSSNYAMFGNAAALVGSGMLIGGAGFELADKYEELAPMVMTLLGALVASVAGFLFRRTSPSISFVTGAVTLMGAAMHLCGAYMVFDDMDMPAYIAHGYGTAAIILAGVFVNIRAVTALAIAPFAQMLDTGTYYFHAAYVFYSPETTLSILHMAVLVGICLWIVNRFADRIGRHAAILSIMGLVVANLCFLVGSLWGDVVGYTLFEGRPVRADFENWQTYSEAIDAWRATFFEISEHVYSAVWAGLLAVGAFWSAHKNKRGLFNTTMTFAAIHGYTQVFESFYDEPMAWAIGGLLAIPLAWGMWRLNARLMEREAT